MTGSSMASKAYCRRCVLYFLQYLGRNSIFPQHAPAYDLVLGPALGTGIPWQKLASQIGEADAPLVNFSVAIAASVAKIIWRRYNNEKLFVVV